MSQPDIRLKRLMIVTIGSLIVVGMSLGYLYHQEKVRQAAKMAALRAQAEREERAKKIAEEEARRKREEEEAHHKEQQEKAAAEAARRKVEEQEREKREEEARAKAEEEKRRLLEEKERLKAEEEQRTRQAAERELERQREEQRKQEEAKKKKRHDAEAAELRRREEVKRYQEVVRARRQQKLQQNRTDGLPRSRTIILADDVEIELMWCPPGRDADGKFVKGFWIGKTELTQKQWNSVMRSDWLGLEENPSSFKGNDRPVERVEWANAKLFCSKANALVKRRSKVDVALRLPTEQEWEYACRARNLETHQFGLIKDCSEGNVDVMAWYEVNSGMETHPVGQKTPNAWGIYDMHGNVWEWCSDELAGNVHVYRGGSFSQKEGACTIMSRIKATLASDKMDSLGFRVACSEE